MPALDIEQKIAYRASGFIISLCIALHTTGVQSGNTNRVFSYGDAKDLCKCVFPQGTNV